MNTYRKFPVKFFHGVLLAATLALFGTLMMHGAGLIWPTAWVLKALIALVAASYLGVIIYRTGLRFGRLVGPLAWLGTSLVIAITAHNLASYITAHTLLIWLVRSLAAHRTLLSALIDLGLSLCALGAALLTAWHTHSIALTLWSFFLVQALYPFIPQHFDRTTAKQADDPLLRFTQAHAQAEVALRRYHVKH